MAPDFITPILALSQRKPAVRPTRDVQGPTARSVSQDAGLPAIATETQCPTNTECPGMNWGRADSSPEKTPRFQRTPGLEPTQSVLYAHAGGSGHRMGPGLRHDEGPGSDDRGPGLVGRVGDTGFEPVTSSVSGKRATTAPIARADDGTRTRDPHLGKVMLYQLSHIRV